MPVAVPGLTVVTLWGGASETLLEPDVKTLSIRRSGDRVMKKALVTLALGATVTIGAVASPTTADARWHRGFPVAPIVGGLAAGAILGAALAAPRPYYDAYAYEPVYFGPRCYVRRERFWDGWRWHVHRVEDCY
jgi:hypothetical protein